MTPTRRTVLCASAAVLAAPAAFAQEQAETPARSRTVELERPSDLAPEHREIDPETGQQRGYAVLPEAQRRLGFVRPVRTTYTHLVCRTDTTMSQDIAETIAREPAYYNAAFCVACRAHLPLAEFVWAGTTERVGS